MPFDYDLVGLDKLPYARGVRAEPSKRCLPGTRVELLRKIQDWALNPVANRVYLLQGTAGKGKTAVAHTVALSLQEAGVVTPFFAFNRYDQERAAHQVLPTLARQLAERNKLYSQYLCDQPPSLLESREPATQVQCLILGGLGDCTVGAPIVFIIDALDECSDARVQAEDRRNMLERLRNCLVDSRLPSNVRFFLTYRPDEDIIRCLAQPIVQATRLSIDKVDGTESDIRAFVKYRLANTHFCDKVHTVAFAAQTLFQSAAVLCLELTRVNSPRTVVFPRELLQRIMQNPGQPLYGTYRAILETHFDTTSAAVMSVLRQLLGWVFVMQSPQPYAVFRSIAKVHLANADDLDFVFLGLGSLLTGVTPASADPIQPLHTSFREFILDTTQSQPFSLGHDLAAAHAEVAYACLRIMNDPMEGLRFNVCSLSRSFILKKHIQDLEQRVFDYISPGLQYACRQGGAHFSFGAIRLSESRIHRELTVLLKRNFLFWLETCGYMDIGHILSESLENFLKWALKSDLTDLYNFISDCIEFKTHFSEAISQSPPQVYLSGLAFAPRQSRVGKLYRNRFFIPVRIAGYGGLRDWPVVTEPSANIYLKASTRPRRSCVFSLAYSPNGRHIALGLNNSVGVWDRESGRSWLAMFHFLETVPRCEGAVEGIAFTPNGRIMASSAMDGIIRMWDMRMPERSRKINRWYSRASLAFSPDGKYVAMASRLDNLMLWDLEHNRCIAKAEAQTRDCIGRIRSMAYSPEGSYIACGTSCGAMWLWNLKTALLFEAGSTTFETRNSAIVSVVFSPNGKTVASISKDSTLQHWDTESQQYLHLPYNLSSIFGISAAPTETDEWSLLRNRAELNREDRVRICRTGTNGRSAPRVRAKLFETTKRIRNLALSPDGRHVATVRTPISRITGEAELVVQNVDLRPKLEEHPRALEEITCVAISSNGKFIAVGLGCGTLRIWDAETLAQVGHDLVGDEERIRSVAFSPDSARVASSSTVVRIWDVETQRQHGDDFRLSSRSARCMVFSPDGRCIVSGFSDGTVRTWDTVENCQVGDHLRLEEEIVCIALSPDGLLIACGSMDGVLRICSVVWGQQIWTCVALYGHRGSVTGVATTRQGTTIVTCSSDSTIRLWDLAHLTSLSRNGARPISESDLATERRQLHTRQIGGWLCHDRLSRFGDPPLDLEDDWASDESCAPFLWIPPRIRRFFPSVYSPFARGVISAYPSFTVSLDNDECLDQWAITYTPPPDHMMEQEMEEDEGEGVVDAV
ncbi:hypothetical protein EV715DRAFT_189255 [Schizophyllum commune]